MLHVLSMVYSLPCFIGAVGWQIIWKASLYSRARWLDVHHPLPDGQKHCVPRISRVWLAGLAASLTLGWVLLATARTEEHTHQLNANVVRCWSEGYQAAMAQINLNAQNDGISRMQQQLQRDYDEDTVQWVKNLLSHPGNQVYAVAVTEAYQTQINDLGRQFDRQVEMRKVLDQQRAEHPLPAVTCGK